MGGGVDLILSQRASEGQMVPYGEREARGMEAVWWGDVDWGCKGWVSFVSIGHSGRRAIDGLVCCWRHGRGVWYCSGAG